jgi:hypothetical protein
MADGAEALRIALKKFVANRQNVAVFVAQVIAVNDDNTVDVVNESGLELYDVRFRATAVDDTAGFIVTPRIGSDVIVSASGKNSEFMQVIMMSEVQSVRAEVETTELVVDSSGVKIQKGPNNLGDILSDLVDAITAITVTTPVGPSSTPVNSAQFIALKTKINQLLQ